MRGKRAGVSCRERSAVRVHYHRLRVVVGEGIMKPWLDRGFAGRVGSGMHTDAFLPQSEMAQNLFDHLALVRQHPAAPVHVEPGMHPAAQHVRPRGRQQALVHEKRDDPRPEHLLQRLEAGLGHDVEQPGAHEQTVSDQSMQVGMEVQVLAEGVAGHDNTGQDLGQAERGAQVFDQALVRDAAEVLEQVAIEAEVWAQHLGHAESEVAMRDREGDRLGQQRPEELDLLLVAGGTEPTTLAREREQVLVLAVIATYTGEAAFEVAAVQKLVDDLRDDGAQEPVPGLVAFWLGLGKLVHEQC